MCCSPWGCKELDATEQLNWTDWLDGVCCHANITVFTFFYSSVILLLSSFTNRYTMTSSVRRDAVVSFSGSASQVTLVVMNSPANAGDIRDAGLIPGSRRSSGGRHDNQLQHSFLENSMDRGAWWTTMHGVEQSWMWLSIHTCSKNLWRTVV